MLASQNGDVRGAALGSERVRAVLGSDGEFALRYRIGSQCHRWLKISLSLSDGEYAAIDLRCDEKTPFYRSR